MSSAAWSRSDSRPTRTTEVYRFTFDDPHVPDSIGRVTSIADAAGTVDVRYDRRGNVIERKRQLADGQTFVMGYAYDSLRRQRGVFYPDGTELQYFYDEAGLPVRIADADGSAIVESATYSALGRPTSLVFGNGTTTTETYDALARLSTLQTAGNGEQIQNRTYAYDTGSNITGITDLAFGRSQSFAYDELNRLARAQGPYGIEDYRYDALGNLLQKGSLVMRYDDDHRQRLVCGVDAAKNTGEFRESFKKCFGRAASAGDLLTGEASDQVKPFFASYDATGNLVSRGQTRYGYDPENRLLSVQGGSGGRGIETNVYDANGKPPDPQGRGRRDRDHRRPLRDRRRPRDEARQARHPARGHAREAGVPDAPRDSSGLRERRAADRDGARRRRRAVLRHRAGVGRAARRRLPARPRPRVGVLARRPPPVPLPPLAYRKARLFFRGASRRLLRRPGSTGLIVVLAVVLAQALGARASGATSLPALKDGRFYYHSDHISSVQAISDQVGRVVRRQDYKPFGEEIALDVHAGAGAPRPTSIAPTSRRSSIRLAALLLRGASLRSRHWPVPDGRHGDRRSRERRAAPPLRLQPR